MRLDPKVIDLAMQRTECASLDEFGWKYLNKSGTTARNYRDGKTIPNIPTLMILKRLTGYTIDQMILQDQAQAA